jgi:hypothetical protein
MCRKSGPNLHRRRVLLDGVVNRFVVALTHG